MKLIIFDLDGTLLDSIGQVYQSVCVVFATEGKKPPTLLEYYMHFSYPWINGFRKFGIEMPESEIAEIFEREMNKYPTFNLFPDVIDYMVSCHEKEHAMAVVSSNSDERVHKILASHGVLPHLQFVSGGHGDKTRTFLRACHDIGVPASHAIAVGDTFGDMLHAQNAGIRPIGIVRYPEIQESREFKTRMRLSGARDVVHKLSFVY